MLKAVSWIATLRDLVSQGFLLLALCLPVYFSHLTTKAESAANGADVWYRWKRPSQISTLGTQAAVAPLAAPDDSLGSETVDPSGDMFPNTI